MNTLWNADSLAWLALACFEGMSAKILYKLWSIYTGCGDTAFLHAARHLKEFGCHTQTITRFQHYQEHCDALALSQSLLSQHIDFIRHDDARFPFLLAQIPDPPFALFVRGVLATHPPHPIAIVGTRRMSAYGKEVTTRIVTDLVRAHASIISGLALGIDSVAHHVAIDHDGICIAVLGSGIDNASVYPKTHLGLVRDILAKKGAIISEYPPGTPGLKHHFPMRNRIIAGLAQATVVIEAAKESGSLITAHLALQYDRDVFAVPGPITDERSSGTNKLLSLGARVCTSASDILPSSHIAKPAQCRIDFETLTEQEKSIASFIRTPAHIDDIARHLGMPFRTIAVCINALELRGIITCHAGDRYSIAL